MERTAQNCKVWIIVMEDNTGSTIFQVHSDKKQAVARMTVEMECLNDEEKANDTHFYLKEFVVR